jgi:hypothetical protein
LLARQLATSERHGRWGEWALGREPGEPVCGGVCGGEGGEGAEAVDDGGEGGEEVVYVFGGVLAAEGEAEGAAGEVVRDAHGGEDVAGFEGAGGAGGSGAGGDAGEVEGDEDRFAFDVTDEGGDVAGESVAEVAGADDGAGGDESGEFVDESLLEGAFVGEVCLASVGGQLEGGGEADDGGGVFGAGATSVFLAAADDLGLERGAGSDVEGACAAGAVELVGGEGEEVDVEAVDVEAEVGDGLDGVGVDEGAGVFGANLLGDGGDVVECADFVVGVHDGDEDGVVRDGGGDIGGVDAAVGGGGDEGDGGEAVALELLDGIEDGVVFGGGGDEVGGGAARNLGCGSTAGSEPPSGGCEYTAEGEGVGFGTAGGEDDFVGGGADGLGDGGAGLVDGVSGVLGFEVDGAGVVPALGEVGEHGFDDGGVWWCGCGVVEVDAVVQACRWVGRVEHGARWGWGGIGGGHWSRVARGLAPRGVGRGGAGGYRRRGGAMGGVGRGGGASWGAQPLEAVRRE